MKLRKQRYASQIAAVKRANTGRKFTREHREKLARARRGNPWKNKKILLRHPETGEEIVVDKQIRAAEFLGVSKPMISNALLRPEVYHTVRGWKITAIPATKKGTK